MSGEKVENIATDIQGNEKLNTLFESAFKNLTSEEQRRLSEALSKDDNMKLDVTSISRRLLQSAPSGRAVGMGIAKLINITERAVVHGAVKATTFISDVKAGFKETRK